LKKAGGFRLTATLERRDGDLVKLAEELEGIT